MLSWDERINRSSTHSTFLCVINTSIHLIFFFIIYPSIHPSTHLSLHPHIPSFSHSFMSLCINLFVHPSIFSFIHPPTHSSIQAFIHAFIRTYKCHKKVARETCIGGTKMQSLSTIAYLAHTLPTPSPSALLLFFLSIYFAYCK